MGLTDLSMHLSEGEHDVKETVWRTEYGKQAEEYLAEDYLDILYYDYSLCADAYAGYVHSQFCNKAEL